jgi:Flp pilus assembly protein TadD
MSSLFSRALPARALIVLGLLGSLGACAGGPQIQGSQVAPVPPSAARTAQLLAAADRDLAAGDLERAESVYGTLLGASADNSHALLGLGEVQLRRGAAESALATFRKIADPVSQPKALQGQGLALAVLHRRDEAVAVLAEATAQDSTLWRGWSALGQLHDERQEWAAAGIAYQRALALQPESAEIYNNLGVSMLLQRRYDEARAHFLSALERDPTALNAQANLRVAYAWSGEYQKALAHAPPPEQAQVLNNTGYVAMERGDFAAAETLLTEALRASPSFYKRASDNLAELRRRSGRPGRAQ